MAIRTQKQKTLAAEIVSTLDWCLIAQAIRSKAPLSWPSSILEEIAEMCYLACEVWLPQDIENFKILKIEEEVKLKVFNADYSYTNDIFGEILSRGMCGRISQRFVLDWKSCSSADAIWESRMRDSWQWKTYLYFTGADVFIYRGVQRDCGATREVVLHRYPTLDQDVELYIQGVVALRDSLAPFQVYPRHMPSSCGAYGRQCDYFYDCRENTMPLGYANNSRLGYSLMDSFLLCPEKYRRDSLIDRNSEGESSLILEQGSAFHRGQAEIYRQLFLPVSITT